MDALLVEQVVTQQVEDEKMKSLPNEVHGPCEGNHKVAIDRTSDIARHVSRAIDYLTTATDEKLGPALRGGYLREADQQLDAIIRFANCAKTELRIAHGLDRSDT